MMATKNAARMLAVNLLEHALRPHNPTRGKQMTETARQLREEIAALPGGEVELQPLRLSLLPDAPKKKT